MEGIYIEQLNLFITAEVKEPHAKFKVYEVSHIEDGNVVLQDHCQNVEDIDECTPIVEGSVKWDGCSDWNFRNDVYIHFCTREGCLGIGQALAYCWDWAEKNLENFDG